MLCDIIRVIFPVIVLIKVNSYLRLLVLGQWSQVHQGTIIISCSSLTFSCSRTSLVLRNTSVMFFSIQIRFLQEYKHGCGLLLAFHKPVINWAVRKCGFLSIQNMHHTRILQRRVMLGNFFHAYVRISLQLKYMYKESKRD